MNTAANNGGTRRRGRLTGRGILCTLTALLPVLWGGSAEAGGPWKGKQCAVVLTYDDALPGHLGTVIPLLDSLGFRGTFYVPGYFPGLRANLSAWAAVAAKGHELGNHTLFHPCDSRPAGRDWVSAEYDLRNYTVRRMSDEILLANVLLESIDGRTTRSFAYPCGDRTAGESSYLEEVRRLFPCARGVEGKLRTVDEIDPYDVGAFMMSDQTPEEMIGLVEQAAARKALLVFLFHGVGGGHAINAPASSHRILLSYLKSREGDVWVAPLREVIELVRETRAEPWRPPGQ